MKVVTLCALARRLALLVAIPSSMNADSTAVTLRGGTVGESRFSAGASASNGFLPTLLAGKPKDDAPRKKSKPDNRFQVTCTFKGDRAVCRYASTVRQRTAVDGRITAGMSPPRAIGQHASENMKNFTFAALDASQSTDRRAGARSSAFIPPAQKDAPCQYDV
ncbi:TPA: hypothetical protein SAY52_005906 [Burkholderia cenocepacia]|uniref:hypothetical protein n=1 Tax=unclassified Burkholderia TaxID=2613784 RepID=UPI00158CAE3C|nr:MULTISPECIES: hypothetical protein [unclassified Burkholderia]HEF5875211.1 hypothetical protein [Burkholderia cenocepacia]